LAAPCVVPEPARAPVRAARRVGRALVPDARGARVPPDPAPPERYGVLPALPAADGRAALARALARAGGARARERRLPARARRALRAQPDLVPVRDRPARGDVRRGLPRRLRLLDGVPR